MQIFLPIFEALNKARVRYVVAGGLATVLHGYQRLTGDIDLILDLEDYNARKALTVLDTLKFKPRAPVAILDFAEAEKRNSWIKEKGLPVFSLHATSGIPIEIDLFVEPPMPFDDIAATVSLIAVQGIDIPILSIDHLIQLKRIAGRPQDLEDIRALEIIRNAQQR